ncbi:hypothetical protein [Saccharibacillus alkalitolerans]|uniref:Uncharacterized protein n=1 Tax=Saccharibacillus alkalitolerans TaxID=2705290 RepID=A0ABX0F9Q8_9BACL|nr:hypothetical protein [Saccharibacillus alkalitolerans]NGZ77671.1 hypothetical protein [Saccharibacillus alkalitolerans]
MKDKKIADIRLFEQETGSGRLPDNIGKLYATRNRVNDLSARMARILRTKGFLTGDFDHLYVVLTPELPQGEVRGPKPSPMKRIRFYEAGLPPEPFNGRSREEQETELLGLLAAVLKRIAGGAEQLRIVEETYRLLRERGSEAEIDHLNKETRQYRVSVSYQIRPLGRKSTAIIEYIDRLNGVTRRNVFQELNRYEDIYFLAGSMTVKNGLIVISPRTSDTAKFHIRSYRTPIEIALNDIPIAD